MLLGRALKLPGALKFPASFCAALALLPVTATGAFAQTSDSSLSSAGVQLDRARQSKDPEWAKFASGKGSALFLAAGTLLPLATDGREGKERSIRTLDALLTSTLLTSGLKVLTHQKRPDSSSNDSFPSGHASAAFTVAAMQAQFYPRQALLWYSGAAVIAASRVKLRRHYTRDVAAGAALGFFSARLELKQGRGLLLRPFIQNDGPNNRVTGLSFGRTF